jgi:hypothetical protein
MKKPFLNKQNTFSVIFPVRKDLTLRLQFRFFNNLHRKTGTMIQ